MPKKKQAKEKSPSDHLSKIVEVEYPEPSKRTPQNIEKLFDELVNELRSIGVIPNLESGEACELSDELCESDDDYEPIGRLSRDDFPDDVIPFVVLKKEDLYLDYTCPHCGEESKYLIGRFTKSSYKEYSCPKCKKDFLLRLDFIPQLKTYLSVEKGENK